MARIRTIKPDFWTDERVVELSPWARLLFIGLWNFADDDGRMVYSPKRIKMQIFPADSVECSELFDELRRDELVEVYEVDGKEFLQITNFSKHQKIDRRSASKHPPPPNPAESRRIPPTEGKGREGNTVSSLRSDTDAGASSPDDLGDLEVTEFAPGVSVVQASKNEPDLKDPKTQLYDRGAEVLGKSSGGQVTKLLRAQGGSVPKARAILETASTKANAAEYVAAIIHGKAREPDGVEARVKWAI